MKTISKASVAVCVLGLWVVGWIALSAYQDRSALSTGEIGRFVRWTDENSSAMAASKYRPNDDLEKPKQFNIETMKLGHGLPSLVTSMNTTVNVLLAAYQRSGSSLLGEILSVRPDAMYIFEPLIEISCRRRIYETRTVATHLRQLFNCDPSTLTMIGANRTVDIKLLRKVAGGSVAHEPEVGCRRSKVKVIKTIRLSVPATRILMEDATLGIKIVHLVRDPRAILNSMAPSDTWSDTAKTPRHQCESMRRDLKAGAALAPDRYIRVRYEDLVDNPIGVATELYKFLGVAMHKSLPFYLATHTESERFYKLLHRDDEYFSTYRKSNYDNNSWKRKMTKERRLEIEKECRDVIQLLQYTEVLSTADTTNTKQN